MARDVQYLGVGDLARRFGVRPSRISQLFYEQRLDESRCPIISGRRIIPADYIEVVAMELRRKGLVLQEVVTVAKKNGPHKTIAGRLIPNER